MNFYYSDFVMKRKEKNGRVWTEVQNELWSSLVELASDIHESWAIIKGG